MASTAITYSTLGIQPIYDASGKLRSLLLRQSQTWDGALSACSFPATAAQSRQIGDYLVGKTVRITDARVFTITWTNVLVLRVQFNPLGYTYSPAIELRNGLVGANDSVDIGAYSCPLNINWNSVTATANLFYLMWSSAPTNTETSYVYLALEVIE